jgi:hypothetical protein
VGLCLLPGGIQHQGGTLREKEVWSAERRRLVRLSRVSRSLGHPSTTGIGRGGVGREGVVRHLVSGTIFLRNDHNDSHLDHSQVLPHPSACHRQKWRPVCPGQGPADPAEEATSGSEDHQTPPPLRAQLIVTKLTPLLNHRPDGVARPKQTYLPR